MERWILYYAKQGIKEFAISSSGNSAVSAAKYCAENNVTLNVFLSPNAAREKIERVRAYGNIILRLTRTPNKDAFGFCRKNNIVNLRASKDDIALEGYKDIAFELMEQLPRIDNLFIPTSSGTTLAGMYRGYEIVKSTGTVPVDFTTPAFYAVQTTKVHQIASYFDKNFVAEKTSRATAIVDNIAHRKDSVIKIIKETGGGGFVISNRKLEEAREELKNSNILGSDPTAAESDPDSLRFGWHSALSFAGFLKWQKQNPKIAESKISVCIFTD